MPQAIWQTPQPAGGFAPYDDEPRGGLAGFFNSPDAGAEISDRMGGIAEILMRLGSGQGGQGIAAMQGGINDRSAARRDRRKMERMVRRAADKIAPSNPEMAAMMYANPEYGMQILGKKYESEWSNAAQMEQLKKQYELQGINQISELREKQRLLDEQTKADAKAFWGDGTTTGGGGGFEDPWSTQAATPITQTDTAAIAPVAPTPPVVPRGVDPVTQQPLMGEGMEPAPSQPPVPQPVVSQPEQAAPAEAVAQTESSMPPPPPLSKDPEMAARQKRLSRLIGVPAPAWAVKSLEMAKDKDARVAIINNIQADWARQVADHRKTLIEDRRIQEANVQKQKEADEAAERERKQAGLREDEYMKKVVSIGGSRGPMSMGQKQPYELDQIADPSLPNRAILKNKQFSDEDINIMSNPDMQAETLLAAERAGGAQPATTLESAQKALDKRRTDVASEAELARQGSIVQQQVQAMRDTVQPDPRTGQYGRDQKQQLAELDSILAGKPENAPKAFNDWREQNRQLATDLASQANAAGELAIKQSAEKRQVDTARMEQEKVLAAAETSDLAGLTMAFDAQDNLYRTMKLLNDPNNVEVVHGFGGWIAGKLQGTTRSRAETYLKSVQSVLATQALQGMKKQSATGATGLGNTNAEEIELVKTVVADALKSLESGEDTEYMLKKVHNTMSNMIMPDGGKRLDLEEPGFQLRDFDMKRDNRALWIQQQRKNTIKDEETGVIIRPNQ